MKLRFAAGVLSFLTCLPMAAQRLPRVVFPLRYELTITPDLVSEVFRGEETIAVTIEQPLKSIEINASEIAFDRVTVTSAGDTQTASVRLSDDGERAALDLQRPLHIGAATIQISYTGKLNRQLRGFYIGQANGKKYVASQMEALDARFAFPSFDEPEYKAQFSITVVIDNDLKAFSNSAVESETAGPGAGKRTVRFALTPRMSTYLVALVIGDFDCLSDTADGVPTRVCVSPDRVQHSAFALSESNKLLRFFNRYYSIRYPFDKLDHLGV
ncbi:MAG: M1 family metallopeptidase, partial [Thermoanaerobaculia bacterium]